MDPVVVPEVAQVGDRIMGHLFRCRAELPAIIFLAGATVGPEVGIFVLLFLDRKLILPLVGELQSATKAIPTCSIAVGVAILLILELAHR